MDSTTLGFIVHCTPAIVVKNEGSSMQRSKTERIGVRASVTVEAMLQQAAASETLADRRLFALRDVQWQQFQSFMDADPKDKPALKRLLSEPSVFG